MESNSCRITLPAFKAVTARPQAPAGNGVYFRLASVVGPPSVGIRDAPAVGFPEQGRRNAEPADREMQTASQGKERPLESGLLAKGADFRDELRRRQRCSTGKRGHLKDGAPSNCARRYRANHIFDWRVKIAFREKSIIEETKAGRADDLTTIV